MIEELKRFFQSKDISLENGKVIVNKKLVFIINDQFNRYIKKQPGVTFMDFIYQNAVRKNKNDQRKINDFFSRILNTFIHLNESVLEIKSLLQTMVSKDVTGKDILYYFDIRSNLLQFKGEKTDLNIQTSLISLRQIEVINILKLYSLDFKDFEQYLKQYNKEIDQQIFTLDQLLYYLVSEKKGSKKIQIDDKKIKILTTKNKLRRTIIKIKFINIMLKVMKRNKNKQNLQKLKDQVKSIKKQITEKVYYKKQIIDQLVDYFIIWKSEKRYSKINLLRDGLYEEVQIQKKNYYYFLSKFLSRDKNKVEQSEHLVHLLYLKQLSDLKRIIKEIDKITNNKQETANKQKIEGFIKDIFIYEFIRRETIEGLKSSIKTDWEIIIQRKFSRNEKFDKEIIGYIKKIEKKFSVKFQQSMLQRENQINTILDRIKSFPVFDDIISVIGANLNHLNYDTTINNFFKVLGINIQQSVVQSQLFQKSKILQKTQMFGKSNLNQQGIVLCANCKDIIDKKKEEENDDNQYDDDETKTKKVLQENVDANKSILNYVQRRKSKNLIQENQQKRQSVQKQEFATFQALGKNQKEDNNDQQNDLPPPPIFGQKKSANDLPPPPIFGQKKTQNDLPPPPIFGQKKSANDLPPPPIFGQKKTQNDLPPPPIFGQKKTQNDLPPPPIFGQKKTQNDLPPPPIFGQKKSANDLPPPPVFGLKKTQNDLPPPPVFGQKKSANDLPPPPIFGQKKSANDLPPPPVFGQKKSANDLPPPPVFGLKKTGNNLPPPPVFGLKKTGNNLPPPPVFGLKKTGDKLPPPPVYGQQQKNNQVQPPVFNQKKQYINPNQFTTATFEVKQQQPVIPKIAQSDGRKMKSLFWDKIPNNKLQNSIWEKVFENQVAVKLFKINELFEEVQTKKFVQNVNKMNKLAKMDLIGDESRERSINIATMKLFKINKLTWEETKQMIIEIDDKKIDTDSFLSIEKLKPLPHEIEIGKNFKGDIEMLTDASRWIVEMYNIPRYSQRFKCMQLKIEFTKEYDNIKLYLENFFDMMEAFQEDKNFHNFLRICLDAGNILNTGHKRRGNAYGFKVITLNKFYSCKSSVQIGLRLLDYLIQEFSTQDKKSLDFIPKFFKSINSLLLKNLQDVVNDIMNLKGNFNLLRSNLEAAEQETPQDKFFIKKFQNFLFENGEKIVFLEEEGLRVKEYYFETMLFIGEIERNLKDKKSKDILKEYQQIFKNMMNTYNKVVEQLNQNLQLINKFFFQFNISIWQ